MQTTEEFAPSNLRDAFHYILAHYPEERQNPFAGNPLAKMLRVTVPEIIKSLSTTIDDYLVEGSAGKGNWARSPWIAIFDRLITDSAQRGFYPAYLFREDFSGLYLSLNQGVTSVRETHASNAKTALRTQALDFRSRIGDIPSVFQEKEIDLRRTLKSSLSADYEAGNIAARFYASQALPSDEELRLDLLLILHLYKRLGNSDPELGSASLEDDEVGLMPEDYARIRLHKRVERNARLSKRVKQLQGLRCKACGLLFSERYPGIAKSDFIEAHHLVPISQLHGERILRDPRTDFTVLCANCHRMIHKFECPWDLEGFIKTLNISD